MNFLRSRVDKKTYHLWQKDLCPDTPSDILGNPSITSTLETYVISENALPNMILSGPSGCGKSSLAKAVAKKYLGDSYPKQCFTVYGSVNRGKDIITGRSELKKPSENQLSSSNIVDFIRKKSDSDKPKIVIIYDIDGMQPDTHTILSRTISKYVDKARFILTTDDIYGLHESLQSQCTSFKLSCLDNDEIDDLISKVSKKKNMKIPASLSKVIRMSSSGDMKYVVNTLQVMNCSEKCNLEHFYKIFSIPSFDLIERLLLYCQNKKLNQAYKIVYDLLERGYENTDILDMMFKYVINIDVDKFSEQFQQKAIEKIADCLSLEHVTKIQLYHLLHQMAS